MADGTQVAVDHRGEGRDGSPMPDRRRRCALVLLCSAFCVVVSDSTIAYTALPSIEQDLQFGPGNVQWVIIAYALVSAGFLLLGGRVADILGRRRVFMAGAGLFTGASLLCGISWSSGVLITARVIEGIGGAVMVPAALSILMAMFPEGQERNRALGVWGSLAGLSATLGLLAGGPLTDGPGWRWIFLVNVPVGIAVLVLSPRLLSESREPGPRRSFDLAGAVTVTLALLAFVYAIAEAPDTGWTALPTLALFAAAAALAVLFVRIERRAVAPLVPLRLFRSRMLVGGNLVMVTAGMAVDGLLFTFTFYAQQVLGYTAVQFGLAMTVMTVSSFFGVFLGQHVVTRIGLRPVAIFGLALIATASLLLSRVGAESSFWGVIVIGLVIFGPGMGAAFVAGQIAALTGVASQDAGLASGVEETSFAIGNTLGVAVMASVAASQSGAVPGVRAAFVCAAAIAGLGLVVTLPLLRGPRRPAPQEPAGNASTAQMTI